MIFEHFCYRSYLKAVLAEKIARNPSYSMRAMARTLGVVPSQLCSVTQGKKNFSDDKALDVARKLGLKGSQVDYFCLLVKYETASSPDAKARFQEQMRALGTGQQIIDLELDSFRVIADWYHFPVLEMCSLNRFKPDPLRIARRLGISPLEAEVAIERLLRLGLLIKTSEGKLVRTHDRQQARSKDQKKLEPAISTFQKQMLALAAQAIETQSRDSRISGTETCAIDPTRLPEARKLVDEFFNRMLSLLTKSENRTAVYQIGVQVFDLSDGRKKDQVDI